MENKLAYMIIFIVTVLNIGLVIYSSRSIEYNNEVYSKEIKEFYRSAYDRQSMREYNYSIERYMFNGIYFSPEYYCVWTEGRNETEIYETDTHELCHDLVYNEYEHFCLDSPQKHNKGSQLSESCES